MFTDFSPLFFIDDVLSRSSKEASFSVAHGRHATSSIAILSSDLFWWWYTIASNLWDLPRAVWSSFPVPISALDDMRISDLGADYIADLRANSTVVENHRTTGRTREQSFQVRKSKEIIDEIDVTLAAHYGLDEEEVDFLVNYDIKYRIGGGQ